jgi:hypothetical protein
MEELWIIASKKMVLYGFIYLSPAIKQRNGNSVAKLKLQDDNIRADGSRCDCDKKFLLD